MGRRADRISEAAILALTAALAWQAWGWGGQPPAAGEVSLADTRVQRLEEVDRRALDESLGQVRRLVDGQDPSAAEGIAGLEDRFPGRHEVWFLAGRFHETAGREDEALESFARAVRLEGDYLDELSPLFAGRRIARLTDRAFQRLRERRTSGRLDRKGEDLLKTVYFLKRRLAGGCE